MEANKRISVHPGRSSRLRCYDVGQQLSGDKPTDCQWHETLIPVPPDGKLKFQLTAPACRIVNAVLKRFGGAIEVYICKSEIFLVREQKEDWDEVDTAMLGIVKNELWPNQAVEMWNEKSFRP